MLDPDTNNVNARRTTPWARAWLAIDISCTAVFVLEVFCKIVAHGVALPPWPFATSGGEKDRATRALMLRQHHADGAETTPAAESAKPRAPESALAARRRALKAAWFKPRGFLSTFWDVNDVVVIGVALAMYAVASSAPDGAATTNTLRLLGVLRGGRPLRLLNHMPAITDMLVSLMASMKALSTAACVMIFCWFAFAVVGMELFKGRFWHCSDPAFPGWAPREQCGIDPDTGAPNGHEWVNVQLLHYDYIGNAFLCTFVLSSGGWGGLLQDALAATEVDRQPSPGANWGGACVFVCVCVSRARPAAGGGDGFALSLETERIEIPLTRFRESPRREPLTASPHPLSRAQPSSTSRSASASSASS